MSRTDIFGPDELKWARRMFPALRCVSGHTLHDPMHNLAGTGNHQYVSIIRDPVMRVISGYQDYILRGKHRHVASISRCIKNPLNVNYRNLQCRMLAGVEDADAAIETVQKHFMLVGLTERFDETAGLLARMCPYPLNLRYYRSIVARNNDVKNRILADPDTVAQIEEANQADRALYTYVKDSLFPEYLRKYPPLADEPLPEGTYTHENQPRLLMTKWYNKLVFRQTMKLRNRIQKK